jgi:hypothetical protein
VRLPARLARLPGVVAVEDLPADLWKRWPPGSLPRTLRWLQACRVPGDGALGILAAGGEAAVAGRAVDRPDAWPPMNAVDVCSGLRYGVEADATEVEAARRLAVPHLLVAFPGYDTGLVGDPAAGPALVSAVRAAAHAGGRLPACAYLPPGEPLLTALQRAGWATGLVAAAAMLELEQPSFAAYLASLSRKRREGMRREMRRFESADGRVEVLPAPDAGGALRHVARLEARVSGRHGRPEPPARPAGVNRRLAAAFGPDMLVVLARLLGRPVASAVLFRHGDELHVRSAGIDYEAAPPVFAHFVATYTTPVRLACRLGLRRVSFGTAALAAKVARGARLVPLAAALPPEAPPALLRLLDRTDRCLRRSLPWPAPPE